MIKSELFKPFVKNEFDYDIPEACEDEWLKDYLCIGSKSELNEIQDHTLYKEYTKLVKKYREYVNAD